MEIRLRTLTPLWTGGVDGTMDRIHESGIIGSLRWWYEAIVRGLGGKVCEGPTGRKCELSGEGRKKYEQARQQGKDWWDALDEAGICDICKVFGTTGWRRRFRLEVVDDTQAIWDDKDRMLNIRPPDRNRGWFLPPGRMGTLTLRLDGDERTLALLAALLLFLERWGSIGAKPQLGYGVFEIENRDEVLIQARNWQWETRKGTAPPRGRPDLRQFGFLRYRFTPDRPGWWTRVSGIERVASQVQPLVSQYGVVPVMPALKNEWRFHRWHGPRESEQEIFGTLRPARRRSKVTASWAYRLGQEWEVRGWAWLSDRRWADKVWGLLQDEESWRTALRVWGRLESYRVGSEERALKLLEGGR